MATPPSPTVKVWLDGQTTDIPFDSTKKVSTIQLEALASLFNNKPTQPNPLDYQIGSLVSKDLVLAPSTTLGEANIVAGADLILLKKHKQGKSDINWAIGMGFYTGIILLFSLYFLASLWPWTTAGMTPSSNQLVTMHFLLWTYGPYAVGPEVLLLFIVFLSGIIGACVWGIYVLAQHFSAAQDFDKAWVAWYLTRPFIGAGLAVIVYAVIRGGIVPAGSGASSVSVVGVSAMAFLVGLFAENAVHMLHKAADSIFGNPPDSTVSKPPQQSS